MEWFASDPHLVFDFVRSDHTPQRLVFAQPVEVVSTDSLSEVRSCFQDVERGVGKGLYAAGYVAYESAPAFDSALKVRPDAAMPLVWFGLFHKPATVPEPPLGTFQLSPWQPSVERAA